MIFASIYFGSHCVTRASCRLITLSESIACNYLMDASSRVHTSITRLERQSCRFVQEQVFYVCFFFFCLVKINKQNIFFCNICCCNVILIFIRLWLFSSCRGSSMIPHSTSHSLTFIHVNPSMDDIHILAFCNGSTISACQPAYMQCTGLITILIGHYRLLLACINIHSPVSIRRLSQIKY